MRIQIATLSSRVCRAQCPAATPASLEIVHAHLSADRLSTYLRACNGELASALRLYAWNTAVTGAFWEVVTHFEITLRNSLDGRFASRHARLGRRGDWLSGLVLELGERAAKDVDKARACVRRKGKRMCHGQIIAAGAFPHAPDRSLAGVERPVHGVYDLRNRIAHHERIWFLPLEDRYLDLLLVLGYIDPEMRAWVTRSSRVPEILAGRPQLNIPPN